jgi:transposase InsO family protein
LRSDNGIEYVNQEFEQFLALRGIQHQTTCVNTPEQNGVAERKNTHLMEVARSNMFTMKIPKFLWGETIKTATYLINRMPLRILSYKPLLNFFWTLMILLFLQKFSVVFVFFMTIGILLES